MEVVHITDWDVRGADDLDLWYGGPGYYYTDETGCFVGPFETDREAGDARDRMI